MSRTISLRAHIETTLELIADREAQLRYQSDVPFIDVSTELFLQWEDCYRPQDAALGLAFACEELLALQAFHEVFLAVRNRYHNGLPALAELIRTAAWKTYSDAAGVALGTMRSSSMAA